MKKLKKISILYSIITSVALLSPSLANADEANVPTNVKNYINSEEYKKLEQEELNKAIQIGENSKMDRASGFWSWQDGIICVTDSKTSGITTGHAALIAVAPYYYATVESNPGPGVEIRYDSWLSRYKDYHIWQVGVKSTTVSQDHNAAQWAVNQLKKPYNYNFFYTSTRSSFYCSHLVWAAYLDNTGVNLDGNIPGIIHPLELVTNGKTTINYYK